MKTNSNTARGGELEGGKGGEAERGCLVVPLALMLKLALDCSDSFVILSLFLHPAPPPPQCFMNAVLQCLSSTKPLRDYCLRREFRQEHPGTLRAQQELTEGKRAGRLLLAPPACLF